MPKGKKLVRRNKPAGDPPLSSKNDSNSAQDEENDTNKSHEDEIEMTNKRSAPAKRVTSSPEKKSNANYRRHTDAKVLESDLEEQSVSVEDIDTFLNGGGPTGDPYDGFYESTRVQWEYQHDRRGGHMLFVEDEETGELVLTDINGEGGSGGVGGDQDNDYEDSPLLGGDINEPSSFRPDVTGPEDFSVMDKFFLSSYIFFQGLLAGFSMALVYIVEQAASDYDLLINYQPSANEIRRILFIFGAISFVGALESFSDAWRRRRYASLGGGSDGAGSKGSVDKDAKKERKSSNGESTTMTQSQLENALLPLSLAALVCFFILFIILLVMAPTEVLISKENGATEGDWATLALEDDKFDSLFSRWKQLSIYRVMFALLGWFISCIVIMVRYLLSSKRDIALSGMLEHMQTLRKKISSLQGDNFDSSMTVEDYQRLINIQKLGVQRSEAALRAKQEHLLEDMKNQ